MLILKATIYFVLEQYQDIEKFVNSLTDIENEVVIVEKDYNKESDDLYPSP